MPKTKKRPAIGDRKWRVEWVDKLAFYEDSTDVDHDACTERAKSFATEAEARAFAEKVWHDVAQHTFGIVELDELEYRSCGDDEYPWLAEWALVGDHSKIFSGEWEN